MLPSLRVTTFGVSATLFGAPSRDFNDQFRLAGRRIQHGLNCFHYIIRSLHYCFFLHRLALRALIENFTSRLSSILQIAKALCVSEASFPCASQASQIAYNAENQFWSPGLVNFVPAIAYYFSLKLL